MSVQFPCWECGKYPSEANGGLIMDIPEGTLYFCEDCADKNFPGWKEENEEDLKDEEL